MTLLSRRGLLILAFSMVAILGVAQVPAYAGVGDLWFVRTIASGIPGAVDIGPVNPLPAAQHSAVSPNGASVHVVSPGTSTVSGPSALSHFRRAGDGTLTPAGCIGQLAGCTPITGLNTSGIWDVVALDDSVYVVSPRLLLNFGRTPSGDLWYRSCFSSNSADPCTYLRPLIGATAIAATATGTDLYVLSDGVVNHFRRDVATGSLTHAGCIGDGRPGCTATAVSGTGTNGTGIAVSGDGGSVYVVASGPGSVAHFRRDAATGSLAYAGCVGRPSIFFPLSGCTDPGADGLFFAWRIAISPTSDSLYVTGNGAVTHLRRNTTTGDIGFAGCIGTAAGCRVEGPNVAYDGIVATPDGQSVYATSARDPFAGHVIHLRRDPATGDLSYAGCIGENTAGWCTGVGVVGAVRMTTSIIVSPDSTSLYVTNGDRPGAITQFNRALF